MRRVRAQDDPSPDVHDARRQTAALFCQRKIRDHKDSCRNRSHRAEALEARVWNFVSDLLKHPDRLRAGLNEMIEREREGSRGDPRASRRRG